MSPETFRIYSAKKFAYLTFKSNGVFYLAILGVGAASGHAQLFALDLSWLCEEVEKHGSVASSGIQSPLDSI